MPLFTMNMTDANYGVSIKIVTIAYDLQPLFVIAR